MKKRRKFTTEFKEKVIQEVKELGSQIVVARKYNIHKGLVSAWIAAADKPTALDSMGPRDLVSENKKLKRILGEKELEIAILRDLLKKTE